MTGPAILVVGIILAIVALYGLYRLVIFMGDIADSVHKG